MAAAALRFAARRVCGRAFERSQAYFTTAASAALKEQQRRLPPLLPRFSRRGSSLRRFSSSESQNVLNNSKGAKPAARVADDVIPPDSPFWKMKVEVPLSIWSPQHPYYVHHKILWPAETPAITSGIVYVEHKYLRTDPDFQKTIDGFRRDRDFLKPKDVSCRCTCCVH